MAEERERCETIGRMNCARKTKKKVNRAKRRGRRTIKIRNISALTRRLLAVLWMMVKWVARKPYGITKQQSEREWSFHEFSISNRDHHHHTLHKDHARERERVRARNQEKSLNMHLDLMLNADWSWLPMRFIWSMFNALSVLYLFCIKFQLRFFPPLPSPFHRSMMRCRHQRFSLFSFSMLLLLFGCFFLCVFDRIPECQWVHEFCNSVMMRNTWVQAAEEKLFFFNVDIARRSHY